MFLISTLHRAARAFKRQAENARAIRQLRAMSDRELQDIGIVRAEIEAVVTGQQHPRPYRGFSVPKIETVKPTLSLGLNAKAA